MNAWKSLGIPDSDSGFLGYKQMKRFKEDPNFEVKNKDLYGSNFFFNIFL